MRRLLTLLLGFLAGCAQLVPAPQGEPASDPLAAWNRVLERFVDDAGRVDFAGLSRGRDDLDRFVSWIYVSSQRFAGRAHELAFHLNAYNALAMYNVLESGEPKTLAGFSKVDFFIRRKLQVRGRSISLYDYENEVIRPFGEERVHFALNCMVRGCPRLPRAPFRAEDLERMLAAETRRFLNEPRNVRVDPAGRKVHLSEILKFYDQDFLARAPSLVAYVNRYRAEQIPEDYEVAFVPYDWTVNRQ